MSQDYPADSFLHQTEGASEACTSKSSPCNRPLTEDDLRKTLRNNIRFFELSLAPRIIIQGECQPANGSKEAATDRSMWIAGVAASLVSPSTKIERFCAFDDTSESNLVDYPSYIQQLQGKSHKPDQIFFYSSPLLRELAVDIFKHLLKTSRSCPRFQILRKEEKVFCEINGKNIAIEIMNSKEVPFPLNGLLFETAISIFKRYHHVLIPFYAASHMLPQNTDIHRSMLDYYTLTDIQSRDNAFFAALPYLNQTCLDALSKSSETTPYLDAIHNPTLPPSPRSVILNVISKDKLAKQAKLNQILEFLGEDPTYSIYFDSLGNIEVESSRIEGPRLGEKKRVHGFFETV